MYVEPESNIGVGSKWGRKSELDRTFFQKPVLYLGLGFGHPLVSTFDQYGCPSTCFTNRFFLVHYFFFFSGQAQARFSFS
jgi:hypothetical protein